jgi:hypothetical protein
MSGTTFAMRRVCAGNMTASITRRQLLFDWRFLELDFRRANSRRADTLHQPFWQYGHGLLAERVWLELAAEQQSVFASELVCQRWHDNL